jgi:hypothetical protein
VPTFLIRSLKAKDLGKSLCRYCERRARIKLVSAVLFFVVPSMMIVTLGPAIITLFRALSQGW